jgi:arylsulfatase A-like enzyme
MSSPEPRPRSLPLRARGTRDAASLLGWIREALPRSPAIRAGVLASGLLLLLGTACRPEAPADRRTLRPTTDEVPTYIALAETRRFARTHEAAIPVPPVPSDRPATGARGPSGPHIELTEGPGHLVVPLPPSVSDDCLVEVTHHSASPRWVALSARSEGGEPWVRILEEETRTPPGSQTVYAALPAHLCTPGSTRDLLIRVRGQPGTVVDQIAVALGHHRPAELDPTRLRTVLVGGSARQAFILRSGEEVRLPVPARAGHAVDITLDLAPLLGDLLRFELLEEAPSGERVTLLTLDRPRPVGDDLWTTVTAELDGTRPLTHVVLRATGDDGDAPGQIAASLPRITASVAASRIPHVVVVLLDTLRPDVLSLYGNPLPTSPHLERWARDQAVVFDNAFSTAPWTHPAHLSLFTGLDALAHGVNYASLPPTQIRPMAEILGDHGYRTLATTGGAYLHPSYGFARGFDAYHTTTSWERPGGELAASVRRVQQWLEEATEPLFVFVHTYDPHGPFAPTAPFHEQLHGEPGSEVTFTQEPAPARDPSQMRRRLMRSEPGAPRVPGAPEDTELALRAYESQVAGVDANLAPLLETISSLERSALVVITSDHGEAFGEEGHFGHYTLQDEVLRIPLMIAAPGQAGGGLRRAEQVGLVDILPTIEDLLALEPDGARSGRSLLPALGPEGSIEEPVLWAAARSSGHGLSARSPTGELLHFDDRALGRDLTIPRATLAPAPEGGGPESRPAPDGHPLRAAVIDRLDAESRGLHIEFRAESGRTLAGRVAGQGLVPTRLKQWHSDAPRIAWVPASRGRGPSFTFVLEAANGPAHLLLAEDTNETLALLPLDPDANGDLSVAISEGLTEQPRAFAPDLGTGPWREVDPARLTHGLLVRRVGVQEADVKPSTEEDDLREQLRALGYLVD